MNKRYQHIVNGWVIPEVPELIGAQTTRTTAPRDLSSDPAFSADFNHSPGSLATMTTSDRSLVADAEDIKDARAALMQSNECINYEEFRRELGID